MVVALSVCPETFRRKKALCDFRKLNDVTIKDAYSLPRIDHCLDTLQNAKYFSTLDLQSGYWQISINLRMCQRLRLSQGVVYLSIKPCPFDSAMLQVRSRDAWK